ncbi:MAG: response regulator transcription factor [Lachnospiraceae bacterium]|nr:response regulator transcription factor [Lachnospiraceae bacterium]
MYKIMIVEDDRAIRLELQVLFQNAGYEVQVVEEFEDVVEQIKKAQPHLVLMDVMLSVQSGLEICMKLRSVSNVPVIFVTNCNTTEDEMRCITMGGDDFVAKPYNIAILLGRIANVLRRTYGNEKELNLISHKGVVINTETGELSYGEEQIELTWSELKILTYLFKKKGTFVSRMSLIEYMWENKLYIDDNTLSVNVTRIRKKLSDYGLEDFIETKRGVGYRI